MDNTAKRLGRGFEELLDINEEGEADGALKKLRLEDIHANPHQPRKIFAEEPIAELAASIKQNGLLQPIVVRPRTQGGYEIISGERRFRACAKLGLETMAALLLTPEKEKTLELALVENIQREDLNPMEIAMAFRELIDSFGSSSFSKINSRVF